MAAAGILTVGAIDQPEPGLMNQSGRLKGLSFGLLGHLDGGQLSQLLVNQRQ